MISFYIFYNNVLEMGMRIYLPKIKTKLKPKTKINQIINIKLTNKRNEFLFRRYYQ